MGEQTDMDQRETLDMLHEMKKREFKGKKLKLLYVTPEKIYWSVELQHLLHHLHKQGKIARIVYDEAHSSIQMTYRSNYLSTITWLRDNFTGVPQTLVTATVTAKDLVRLLDYHGLPKPCPSSNALPDRTVIFSTDAWRSNIAYSTMHISEKADKIHRIVRYILKEWPQRTGIIYCATQKDTEVIATRVQELSGGKIKTGFYHAGLGKSMQRKRHYLWKSEEIHVLCATNAFGLGIDKEDVRFVIHETTSLETFIQESGRCGRDGRPASSILMFRSQDVMTVAKKVGSSGMVKFKQMLQYILDTETCTKVFFLRHLSLEPIFHGRSKPPRPCGRCDRCTSPENPALDFRIDAWRLLRVADRCSSSGKPITIANLADIARDSDVRGKVVTFTKRYREEKRGRQNTGRNRNGDEVCFNLDEICQGAIRKKSLQENGRTFHTSSPRIRLSSYP
ncbi:P-loop containing nucleoside triphosphate hydrolase protein [Flagelloscypha sp. PMI_526]|nr:P-loop containing nucleoside triphosphate hydrolase protein [Flagelloscypha sp. PMI_526]